MVNRGQKFDLSPSYVYHKYAHILLYFVRIIAALCVFVLFSEQLMPLFSCRVRRRFSRGLKRKPMALIKRLRKAKKNAPALEKPEVCPTEYVMHMSYNTEHSST